MKDYKSKSGRIGKEKAVRYGEHIEQLLRKYGGNITPREVVDDARAKKSPLHDYFEWDDSKAGESWRVEQARGLLQEIEIVILDGSGESKDFRAFFNVKECDDSLSDVEKQAYVSFDRVCREGDLRRQVVAQALREAEYWAEKYNAYKELGDIRRVIEVAVSKYK